MFNKTFTSLAFFSIFSVALSGLFMGYLIYKAQYRVRSLDKMPELLPLTPEARDTFGKNPGIATVGLYIKDFSEFDILNNKFQFSGILWFLFDPSIISEATLQNFSFEKGEKLFVSTPSTQLVKGNLLARYTLRVRLKTNLDYSLFPFESHTIFITLDNEYVTPGELIFQASQNTLVISPEIAITGWQVANTNVYTGYSTAQLEKTLEGTSVAHPRAVFALECAPAGMRNALIILLPLILVYFLSLFSLAITAENYRATISLSSGTVSGLIAYRFVIEKLSPSVGYFMLSDYLYSLFLTAVFVIFLINIGLTTIREVHPRLVILAMHLVVNSCFFYLLSF